MSGIKICGLFRDCDVDYVNEARPDWIGFILNFPRSHRSIDFCRAAELRSRLAPGIRAAGVFVDQSPDTVCRAAEEIGLDAVQLHGREDEAFILALRERLGIPVWKALKVRGDADLALARVSPADEILLDNGTGTGACFDWSVLKDFDRPFILAGGLTPENIAGAIHLLRPKMIDISSGVETGKVKDREKILEAVRAVRQADCKEKRDER